MIKLIVFCLTSEFYIITIAKEIFNYKKFDYCKFTCEEDEEIFKSTPCDCRTINDGRIEISDDMVAFRKFIVDEHNKYRNKVASGAEASLRFPAASNMQVINYDMELEYMSLCHLRKATHRKTKHGITTHDACRRVHDGAKAGQNINTLSHSSEGPQEEYFLKGTEAWYREIHDFRSSLSSDTIENYIRKFSDAKLGNTSSTHTGHFTAMIWATVTRVGCARIYIPNFVQVGKDILHSVLITCEYLPTPNMVGSPIYKMGKPCSKCPQGTSCNDKYTSLCGQVEPVPEYILETPKGLIEPDKAGKSDGPVKKASDGNPDVPVNKIFIIIVFILSLYVS